ncbi:MAG: sigma-54-dependent Fis family transcriptional regulator [Deltaproteobacteria bacterium]|nr:MAG: sigma-54-dependent Fis family transcriptional regulator [Deltaproteobacteria bacterium]
MAKILIVDDDLMFCRMLSLKFSDLGHTSSTTFTLEEGLNKAFSEEFDVILLDVRMPDGSGLDHLRRFKKAPGAPEVIIITGLGDPDGAETAIESGAWDYIEKGSSIKSITLSLSRVLQYRREKLSKKPPEVLRLQGIIGNSPAIRACLSLLAQVVSSDANVLLTGETGTGKELFARAIHENNGRSNGNFIVVDCTALPETLAESLIFGHERGAFTGADKVREGMVKQADGGTLFLDEIGELPLTLQKAFLRVLQEHQFRPLGSKHEVTSNFRLVAATNRDLEEMVRKGLFREDLLFRVQSLSIEIPPLRERIDDISEIALYHIAEICKRLNITIKGVSPEFLSELHEYKWPGNVRELVNSLEQAVSSAYSEPILFPKHLPTRIRTHAVKTTISDKATQLKKQEKSPSCLPTLKDLRESALREAEQRYLQSLISVTGGNVRKACQVSDLSRSRFYALLKKHNISKRFFVEA